MIHLTSAVTISYAESNGGIFILIAPLGNTNTGANIRTASYLSTITNCERLTTIQFRLIFKGHKSLEYTGCFMIHLTSAVTISYAESNGGIFVLMAPFGNTNTRTNVLRVIC